MKVQYFLKMGLGMFLLALLVACGQAPLAEPEKDQPASAEVMAWPPRPPQFHGAENAEVSPNENALTEYYQSERDFTSIVTARTEENALDAYHQSEWGRAPNPTLPIIENKVNADQDIGLLEFSTGLTEVGVQRHDREYGLAAFSSIPPEVKEADPPRASNEAGLARYHESEWGFVPNKADADRDIGLMEFFAIPNDTSRQHTEPGALDTLPNIDPADRKFFNPGYGAQTTGAKQSEAIPSSIGNEIGKWSAVWFLLK
jgi:hypothetical protein